MSVDPADAEFMAQALLMARHAAELGEVPVGAVVVYQGEIIARGQNQPRQSHDPTAHAEICAIRQAAQILNNYRLPGCSLYVTIEPCTMCLGAIIHARLDRLIFGAVEPKYGAVISHSAPSGPDFYNHRLQVTHGVLAEPCSQLMSEFFRERRAQAKSARLSVKSESID